ncbi:MAG: hypothetical protein IT462_06725 [Planctomycetes bacterium]|nr:hypothetical protein [Planctomycetota bacterium]
MPKPTSSEKPAAAQAVPEPSADMQKWMDDTHRVLKAAVDRAGPKRVARALDISLSLVYKWTQPARSKANPAASGARNPLDKLIAIFDLSQDLELIHFLCRIARGYYTPNPKPKGQTRVSFVSETVNALNDFADMLQFAEKALTNDGRIDPMESAKLRGHWDQLKGRLEHFVLACEEGKFNIAGKDEEE